MIHMYDINEDTTCENNYGGSQAHETSMIQTKLALSVCTKDSVEIKCTTINLYDKEA
jgi:hypothetical protein